MLFRKVSVIGIGLLGGSLGKALKSRELAGSVTGYARRPSQGHAALSVGAADRVYTDLREAVQGSDLVVLATPIGAMAALAREMGESLAPGTVVTDVGSVKGSLVTELEAVCLSHELQYVGSHPMAGAESGGVEQACSDLFDGRVCVVTPTPRSQPEVVSRVMELWKSVGGLPIRLDPEEHDRLAARGSHLPHVIASALARYVLDPCFQDGQSLLCATGFRDVTRVASGSPRMWREIVLANRPFLTASLRDCLEGLAEFCQALEDADGQQVEDFFQVARERRDRWLGRFHRRGPKDPAV